MSGARVPGWGRLDSRLVLVGEAPGPREEAAGEPFVGPSYHQRLRVWWDAVGLKRHEFRIENVCEYRPPANKADAWDQATWESWMEDLHVRLSNLDDPWLIVPTGNYSLYALTGKGNVHWQRRDGKHTRPGITDWRGSIMSYRDRRGRLVKVIPTIHPAATFRTASYEGLCRRDWAKIAEERHDKELRLPVRTHHISPSIIDIQDYLADCHREGEHLMMAVDIENPQVEKGPPLVAPIVCVGFSKDPAVSLTIPTTKQHWKTEDNLRTAWTLVEELCQLSCSAHNNFHERFWLWKERGLQLPNLVWDTMLMHHALDPTAEHRLDYCASVDTREPFWKHEAKDPEDQKKYTSNLAAFYCVDDETEALTRCGWVRREALKVGDEILAYDPLTGQTVWSPTQEKFEKWYDGPLVSLWWRGEEFARTTPNHRWWVAKRSGQRRQAAVVSSDWNIKKGRRTAFYVPTAGSASTGFKETLNDGDIRVLAWILTEGTIRWRGASPEVVVYQSPHSRHYVALQRLMKQYQATERRLAVNEAAFALPVRHSRRLLHWITQTPHKSFTAEFGERLSTRQVELFFQTLIDGDGSRPYGLSTLIQTADSPLLKDVQALLVRHGWGSTRRERPAAGPFNSKPVAILSAHKGKWINAVRKEDVAHAGIVWCPKTTTGYWIARRRGTTYVTGNTYNGKDCCVQRELLELYYNRLAAQTRETAEGPINGLDWYWQQYAELIGPLFDLSHIGIAIDDARRVQRKHELARELDEIKATIQAYGVDLFAKKKVSGKKVKTWLYDTLKFPQQLRKRSTHEKTLSSDALAIRKLLSHHTAVPLVSPEVQAARRHFHVVAPLLLRSERIAKLREFYDDKRVSSDGRFRSSYNLNTKEGRLNSKAYYDGSGSNGQNVDRESRDMFIADPGCIGLQVDGSQAEGRVCLAWMYHLTGKENLLVEANARPDVYDMHTDNARRILKKQEITKAERYFAKTVVHGAQRMMQGQTMSDNAAKRGIVLDPVECDKAIAAYKAAVPLDEFFAWVKRDVQRNKVLVDTWGGRYDFSHERMDEATFREACSTRMQPEVARWMNQWGLKPLMALFAEHPDWGRLNVHVHDGLFISVIPERAYDVAVFLVEHLERPRKYGKAEMTIPCEVAIGKRWKAEREFKVLPSREVFDASLQEIIE